MAWLSIHTVLYLAISALSLVTAICGMGKYGPISYFPSPIFILAFGFLGYFSYSRDRKAAQSGYVPPVTAVKKVISVLWTGVLLLFLWFVFGVFTTVV